MKIKKAHSIPENCEREFDFALIAEGPNELTKEFENAIFEGGCDDATVAIRHGQFYLEFSRKAESLESAIISAIHDVHQLSPPVRVLRVDECNLVTMAEIARRIDRSRQLVFQYISGERGPGTFPCPEFYINEKPLWAWCAVSFWLASNDLIREEEWIEAEIVCAINYQLDLARQVRRQPALVANVTRALAKELAALSAEWKGENP